MFNAADEIPIFSILSGFMSACDTNGIDGMAAMCLFHFFVKVSFAVALKAWLFLPPTSSSKPTAQNKRNAKNVSRNSRLSFALIRPTTSLLRPTPRSCDVLKLQQCRWRSVQNRWWPRSSDAKKSSKGMSWEHFSSRATQIRSPQYAIILQYPVGGSPVSPVSSCDVNTPVRVECGCANREPLWQILKFK